jgi:hypothetical protein
MAVGSKTNVHATKMLPVDPVKRQNGEGGSR